MKRSTKAKLRAFRAARVSDKNETPDKPKLLRLDAVALERLEDCIRTEDAKCVSRKLALEFLISLLVQQSCEDGYADRLRLAAAIADSTWEIFISMIEWGDVDKEQRPQFLSMCLQQFVCDLMPPCDRQRLLRGENSVGLPDGQVELYEEAQALARAFEAREAVNAAIAAHTATLG